MFPSRRGTRYCVYSMWLYVCIHSRPMQILMCINLLVLMVLTICVSCGCVRWYNTCPMGGCHRLYAPHICQWLCVLHNYCICTLLANGLPQHWGGNQDGHWIVQGGNTCSLHGQVSLTSVVHRTACISHSHWLTTPTKTTTSDDDDDNDDRYNSNNKTNGQKKQVTFLRCNEGCQQNGCHPHSQ